MGNMGYCRFTNTLEDLRDCQEHISDDDLSLEEHKARKKLVELCKQIGEEEDSLPEEYDEDA